MSVFCDTGLEKAPLLSVVFVLMWDLYPSNQNLWLLSNFPLLFFFGGGDIWKLCQQNNSHAMPFRLLGQRWAIVLIIKLHLDAVEMGSTRGYSSKWQVFWCQSRLTSRQCIYENILCNWKLRTWSSEDAVICLKLFFWERSLNDELWKLGLTAGFVVCMSSHVFLATA